MRECGLKSANADDLIKSKVSLPVRECGLKCDFENGATLTLNVTPRAGVWIEMIRQILVIVYHTGHSPCGSVD